MIIFYKIYNTITNNHVATISYNQRLSLYDSEVLIKEESPLIFAKCDHGVQRGEINKPSQECMEFWLKGRVPQDNRTRYDWYSFLKVSDGSSEYDDYIIKVEEIEDDKFNTYRLSSDDIINSSEDRFMLWKIDDTYIRTSDINKNSLNPKYMFESFGEVITSKLGKKLGLDIVDCDLCEIIIDNKITTIGYEYKDFRPKRYSLYSIEDLMNINILAHIKYGEKSGYNALIDNIYQAFGINIKDYLDTMILFDSLVLNTDRTFKNFGLLIGKDVKTLPIFNNQKSLFCDKDLNGIEYEYTKELASFLAVRPFCVYVNDQLSLVDRTRIDKAKLLGLKSYVDILLNEMADKGLEERRAIFIKDLLMDRIDYITKL